MELSLELDRIKVDAEIIQGMLETLKNSGKKRVCMEAGTRILECCERLTKRTKVSSPRPVPVLSETDGEQGAGDDKDSLPKQDGDDKDCLAKQDGDDKDSLLKQSERAGEARMSFGKHKGMRIKEIPLSYLSWLLGVKRVGREFEKVAMDKHGWIVSNHADIMAQVKSYLTWRCWACGSCDVRFKFSRLCMDCWHSAGVK